jgi:hypothetical protein
MMKRIRSTSPTEPIIRSTSATEPSLDPRLVAKALGAEPTGFHLQKALAPITLASVRAELYRRLRTRGGRPGLSGASRRAKIPLSDQQWSELEALAAKLATPESSPSAGQVGSVLLSSALRCIKEMRKGRRRKTG